MRQLHQSPCLRYEPLVIWKQTFIGRGRISRLDRILFQNPIASESRSFRTAETQHATDVLLALDRLLTFASPPEVSRLFSGSRFLAAVWRALTGSASGLAHGPELLDLGIPVALKAQSIPHRNERHLPWTSPVVNTSTGIPFAQRRGCLPELKELPSKLYLKLPR